MFHLVYNARVSEAIFEEAAFRSLPNEILNKACFPFESVVYGLNSYCGCHKPRVCDGPTMQAWRPGTGHVTRFGPELPPKSPPPPPRFRKPRQGRKKLGARLVFGKLPDWSAFVR